jgi:hypothetical protein
LQITKSAYAETSQDIRRSQGNEKSGTLYRKYYVIKRIFVVEFTGEVAVPDTSYIFLITGVFEK